MGYLNSRDVVSVGPDGPGGEHGGERGAFSVDQKETILYYEVPLTSLDGLVGQHSFPFAVRLPEVLPPSVEVRTELTHFHVDVDLVRAVMTTYMFLTNTCLYYTKCVQFLR